MRICVLLGLAALAAGVACSGSSGGGGSTQGTPDGGSSGGGSSGGGSSGGGSSGGGSSSGGSSSGGSSSGDAGADCSTCDKAQTCCDAMMGDASTCSNFSGSTCQLAPSASDQSAYISTCEAQVQSGKAAGIPACM